MHAKTYRDPVVFPYYPKKGNSPAWSDASAGCLSLASENRGIDEQREATGSNGKTRRVANEAIPLGGKCTGYFVIPLRNCSFTGRVNAGNKGYAVGLRWEEEKEEKLGRRDKKRKESWEETFLVGGIFLFT